MQLLSLTTPLFLLILLGYLLARFGGFSQAAADALTRFVFWVALPAFFFPLMTGVARQPRVDSLLLVAYFGGCVLVFTLSSVVAHFFFRMNGAARSVFGVGSIFSNIGFLGVPLGKVALGDDAMPAISMILVFNTMLLWTLVSTSVSLAQQGPLSPRGLVRTAQHVLTNPIVVSIVGGTLFGLAGGRLPDVLDRALALAGQGSVSLALISLGMALSHFGVRTGWRESLAICALKLVAMPVVVYVFARVLALPRLETKAIVLVASLPVGANVHLMAREFDVLGAPVASSLVLSTGLSSVAAPIALFLMDGPN